MTTDPVTDRPLTDPFGRRIAYLRLSVTDRCDLRCGYCLPKGFKGFKGFEEPEHWLDFDEITRVVAAFAQQRVHRLRITGGEPPGAGRSPAAGRRPRRPAGDRRSLLSSNCTRMESRVEPLYRAGVRRLNASLNSLRPEVFARLTGGHLDRVLRGIEAARRAGFHPIRINKDDLPSGNADWISPSAAGVPHRSPPLLHTPRPYPPALHASYQGNQAQHARGNVTFV